MPRVEADDDLEFTDDEIRKLEAEFERRDAADLIGKAVRRIDARDREIERLERQRDSDWLTYHRSGGSDRLLELLKSE